MNIFAFIVILIALYGCAQQQSTQPASTKPLQKGGWCVVEVIVTKDGGVRDEKLVECQPENHGFGESSLVAAAKLKYNPRLVNGEAVEVPGVLYKFTFRGIE